MPRAKREQADQIILELRGAEMAFARGRTVPEAAKKIGVTEQTFSPGRRSGAAFG
jgi:hypothetical protein